MGYYLSKANRDILETFIPKMYEYSGKSFVIKLKNPQALLNIIRQASRTPEYSWLLANYRIFINNEDVLQFNLRAALDFELEEVIEDLINDSPQDFFSLANIILLEKPKGVVFTNIDVSPEDFQKLTFLAEANNMNINQDGSKIIIRSKINES